MFNKKRTYTANTLGPIKKLNVQATNPSQCVGRIGPFFIEHSVYVITTFHVIESMSVSLATGNRNKITLCLSTSVVMDDSFLIHQYGLTLLKSHEINRPRLDSTRLVGMCFAFVF